MTITTSRLPRRRSPLGTVLLAPFAPRTWLATAHLVTGFPLGLATTIVTAVVGALAVGFAITFVVGVILLVVFFACQHVFTAVQRSRFRAFLGVRIDPLPARPPEIGRRSWFMVRLRTSSTWRQAAYHLLAGIIGAIGFALVVAGWCCALTFTTAFVHGRYLPVHGIFGWDMRAPGMLAGMTVVGVALLFAIPWVARALAAVDAEVARALLGPSRNDLLARRVEALSASRAGVVDAADAERRRIERDLHDGAQQRLVALAMNLGMTRAAMDDDDPAKPGVVQAHEEAKQALAELRDLVRGMHPAVLEDRGLDAALSGIAARSPVPVRLRVDLPRRPPPMIEAVAYFVVSEALTNVAKHAHAAHADVSVELHDTVLWLVIADDGRGGADPDGGSGLRGLRRRVESVDGTFEIDSPIDGPTVVTVELPCAW